MQEASARLRRGAYLSACAERSKAPSVKGVVFGRRCRLTKSNRKVNTESEGDTDVGVGRVGVVDISLAVHNYKVRGVTAICRSAPPVRASI